MLFNYQPPWRHQTRILNLINKGKNYFEELGWAEGKIMMTYEEFVIVKEAAISLQRNKNTGKYFNVANINKYTCMDLCYRYPIYFKYGDVDCKALIDILVVTKENEKITSVQRIYLKMVHGNVLDFPSIVKENRYELEDAWHDTAVKEKFGDDNIEYKPSVFIVSSTSENCNPIVFELSDIYREVGMNGYKKEGEKEVKGIKKLMDDFNYYKDRNFSLEEKEVEEGGGKIKLEYPL